MIFFFLLIPSILFSAPSLYKSQFKEAQQEIKGVSKTTGTISVIFLRVEFSDVKFSTQDFSKLMEDMRNYYENASSGKLHLVSTITNAFNLGTTMAYYGKDPTNLKNDVIGAANNISLSSYDSIMILHAGYGEETTNNPDDIYSQYIGGTISVIPEMEGQGISPLGVWCHEFAHQLGLLDTPSAGPWSLMDIGCYNGSGEFPAYPDPYSRIRLGWVSAIATTTLTLNPNDNSIYQLGTQGVDAFFVEKRNELGLPGSGFLVWHIKGLFPNHSVSILQADNNGSLDSGDPFPGPTRNFLLDDKTSPSLPSGFRIEFLIPHIAKAKAFPNPINLNKTKRVFFEVGRGASIDIYNIAGENIKSISDSQNVGRIYWDIDNIASGVYIFIVKEKNGNTSFGKLGVIK